MTVYASEERPAHQVAELRETVKLHATDAASGRCVKCGVLGPCLEQRDATYALAVLYKLPHRAAGATRPERIGARRIRLGHVG